MIRFALFALVSLFAACASTPNYAGDGLPAPAGETGTAYTTRDYYPTDTCIVSGKALGADAVTFTVDNRTFKTCCDKCKAKIEADPKPFIAKLDAAIAQTQLANYPLTTCPISGGKLGEMGAPVQTVLDGTLVQLCCNHCTPKAEADAATLAQKVRQAAFEQQFKNWPLTTCPVSGKPLGTDAVSTMFGTTLVRTCCSECVDKITANPTEWMAKIEAARKAAAIAAYPINTCVVSGKELGADAVTFTAGGRTFRTCCEKCQAKIEADPATFATKLDEAAKTTTTGNGK